METIAAPGDVVQVRRVAEGEPTEIAEGTVTASTELTITLGTRPYSFADGWTCEVVRRDPENLHLPETLSEIDAWLVSDQAREVVLIGKGSSWRTDSTGELVPIDQIIAWAPHAEEEP